MNIVDYIKYYFTLRYYPNDKTTMTFYDQISDIDGKKTERILLDNMYDKLHNKEKIGISLSSGVDSPLVLRLARKLFPEKEIICITQADRFNEQPLAYDIAKKYATKHISINHQSVIQNLKKIVDIMQQPKWNGYHFVNPELAKGLECDILLTGDGGDELYGGYVFRYEKMYQMNYPHYITYHPNDNIPEQDSFFMFDFSVDELDLQYPYPENLNQMLQMDYQGKYLNDYQYSQNQFEKYFGIEIWSPFQEQNIIQFASKINSSEKYSYGSSLGKKILREIAKRNDIPTHGKKYGYSLNVEQDLNNNWDFVKNELSDRNQKIYDYLNFNWIDNTLAEKKQLKPNAVIKIIQALALKYWFEL